MIRLSYILTEIRKPMIKMPVTIKTAFDVLTNSFLLFLPKCALFFSAFLITEISSSEITVFGFFLEYFFNSLYSINLSFKFIFSIHLGHCLNLISSSAPHFLQYISISFPQLDYSCYKTSIKK